MTVYYVTVNKPGYLPEGEPIGCETLADARDALASEINTTADALGTDDGRAEAWDDTRRAQPGDSVMFAGYAHSIAESDEAF